ncbi:hypothetical protein C8A05DRAFT_48406 [Staphylotrichum tortipilum]|uniref:Uncharacterized protein n=1 Tax=Staphylotrichum tortipilum TaxID=2831512 RepID=A0AAN6M936_9PEZI|nr:hypothetical protein C8A05DRAFT_48406 [Staphylotrichum longicolle]
MAAASPAQIADAIESITKQSEALQAPAQSITILNAPLIAIGQGPFPALIAGFSDIISAFTTLTAQLNDASPITTRDVTDEGTTIFNAFHKLAGVQQDLVNTLIGKAGIVSNVPVVGAPVAAVLRAVEGVVDSPALALINLVWDNVPELHSDANALGDTYDAAIKKYEGLHL